MTDMELISFLWNLLWGDLSDGDTPTTAELEILKQELTKRNILDGDFEY